MSRRPSWRDRSPPEKRESAEERRIRRASDYKERYEIKKSIETSYKSLPSRYEGKYDNCNSHRDRSDVKVRRESWSENDHHSGRSTKKLYNLEDNHITDRRYNDVHLQSDTGLDHYHQEKTPRRHNENHSSSHYEIARSGREIHSSQDQSRTASYRERRTSQHETKVELYDPRDRGEHESRTHSRERRRSGGGSPDGKGRDENRRENRHHQESQRHHDDSHHHERSSSRSRSYKHRDESSNHDNHGRHESPSRRHNEHSKRYSGKSGDQIGTGANRVPIGSGYNERRASTGSFRGKRGRGRGRGRGGRGRGRQFNGRGGGYQRRHTFSTDYNHYKNSSNEKEDVNATQSGEESEVEMESGDESMAPCKPGSTCRLMLYCHVCKVQCSSLQTIQTHFAGAKHLKKLEIQGLSANLTPLIPNDPELATKVVKCNLCDITCHGAELSVHIASERHVNTLSKQADLPSEEVFKIVGELPEDAIKKDRKFYCELCKVSLPKQEDYDLHLSGKKHLKKERWQYLNEQASDSDEPETKQYWCRLCNVFCTDIEALDLHYAGNQHNKVVKEVMTMVIPVRTKKIKLEKIKTEAEIKSEPIEETTVEPPVAPHPKQYPLLAVSRLLQSLDSSVFDQKEQEKKKDRHYRR